MLETKNKAIFAISLLLHLTLSDIFYSKKKLLMASFETF